MHYFLHRLPLRLCQRSVGWGRWCTRRWSGAQRDVISTSGAPIDTERLRRKADRLRRFMRRLKLPKLENITEGGVRYALPLRQHQLYACAMEDYKRTGRFLGGFFDGDGCVTVQGDLSGCTLCVNQAFASPGVLMSFLCAFGGGIYFDAAGYGPVRHQLKWAASGNRGRQAARELVDATFVKRRQLAIAADWPADRRLRVDMHGALRELKDFGPSGPFSCCWPYIAGFFDAEGYIKVAQFSASLSLEVSQKHAPVLQAIQKFFCYELPEINVALYRRSARDHRLVVTNTASSCIVLRILLRTGLTQKRRQAEIALTLSRENHADVKDALSELSGNQSRYSRLDRVGSGMSRSIIRLRQKYYRLRRRPGDACAVQRIQATVSEQVEKLNLHKLQTKVFLYRKDIRRLLREGAKPTVRKQK